MLSQELRDRKSNCFSSAWWPVQREPHVLDEEGEIVKRGRPIVYTVLAPGELEHLARTGQIEIRRVGLAVL